MRKWIMRLSTVTIVVMLLESHHGFIESVTNFMIDGVVPFTNLAMGSALSLIAILLTAYFIYKSIENLRFEMLKRSAILYNQQQTESTTKKLSTNKQIIVSAEELELARPLL